MTQNPVQSKTESKADRQARPETDTVETVSEKAGVPQTEAASLPFWRVMVSVFQAAFGVQSKENKERDFAEGKLLPFIVAAILFTVVFVGVLLFVVSLVLGDA